MDVCDGDLHEGGEEGGGGGVVLASLLEVFCAAGLDSVHGGRAGEVRLASTVVTGREGGGTEGVGTTGVCSGW